MSNIKEVDWQKYIERRNSIFYVSLFNTSYGRLLKQTTGFAFSHQLYTLKDNVFVFYKSKKELDVSDQFFGSLLSANNRVLREWLNQAKLKQEEEHKLIELFQGKVSSDYICDHYTEIVG